MFNVPCLAVTQVSILSITYRIRFMNIYRIVIQNWRKFPEIHIGHSIENNVWAHKKQHCTAAFDLQAVLLPLYTKIGKNTFIHKSLWRYPPWMTVYIDDFRCLKKCCYRKYPDRFLWLKLDVFICIFFNLH